MNDRKLTDSEKQEIAEMVYARFYAVVGESVVKKAVWILGAGALAAYLYLNGDVPK